MPATFAEAEVEGVLDDPNVPWFEASVPAEAFEQAFATAVDVLRREIFVEKTDEPNPTRWLERWPQGVV
jgi:hypothetical protein